MVTGEPRRLRILIVTAIVAVAVGALTGIAAGYQLGDRQAPALLGATASKHRSPYGSVTKVDDGSVTITSFDREVIVKTGADTVVTKARGASVDDIVEGDTIIVSGKADGKGRVRADEIVVLPTQWLFLLG